MYKSFKNKTFIFFQNLIKTPILEAFSIVGHALISQNLGIVTGGEFREVDKSQINTVLSAFLVPFTSPLPHRYLTVTLPLPYRYQN